MSTHDAVGIGFGPANLALAIALEEEPAGVDIHFIEAQPDPVWQGGMLLDRSDIQNHPCRDLVTLRNPRSRYTFINYLFEQDRLVEHLNLPMEFPLRKEYAGYIRWATGHFAHLVDLGVAAGRVALAGPPDRPVYEVHTSDGRCLTARALVLGCGRTPLVPAPFDAVRSPRVVHLTRYLDTVRQLPRPPGSVAVVGGSQSAVELVLDLSRRFPDARVVNYLRAPGPRLKDTSPFSEEAFFPSFTDYYFNASRAGKNTLDALLRPTNYSTTDGDVLKELYISIYEQRLDGHQRVFVAGNRVVDSATAHEHGVELAVRELHTGVVTHDLVDLVVLATGFRDLGPGPHQEPYPPLLHEVVDRFRFDDDGYLVVNADYSLAPHDARTPPLFLNGLCESTHGLGDAGSFSLLSVRAATIHHSLGKRMGGANG
ncbi:MAG TPA: SidA/IucD/PvdA family monooxygenase [Micromonosporaceae bacterium]|nr:SidA/IucD/PvdA family monooxygenase [Micromonosporaceae bacterium]